MVNSEFGFIIAVVNRDPDKYVHVKYTLVYGPDFVSTRGKVVMDTIPPGHRLVKFKVYIFLWQLLLLSVNDTLHAKNAGMVVRAPVRV